MKNNKLTAPASQVVASAVADIKARGLGMKPKLIKAPTLCALAWRPIASAPKDTSKDNQIALLVTFDFRTLEVQTGFQVHVAAYALQAGEWTNGYRDGDCDDYIQIYPTHWMPLKALTNLRKIKSKKK